MAAPPIERVLQLGFRFEPKPEDAVNYYLPRLIAGVTMHATIAPFVHRTDIYACEPGVLAAQFRPTPKAGDRFFFTTCKRQPGKSARAVRVAGPGSWHSQGHGTDVKNDRGVKIGEMKKLRYKKGGAFTAWLMDEFSSCAADTVAGDRQYVLCKMYVSPRAAPDSAARQESAAFVAFAPPQAPEVQEPVAAAPIPNNNNNNKRTAPPIAEATCPTKRIQPAAAAVQIPIPPPLPSPVQASCSTIAVRYPSQEVEGLDFDFDIDVDYAKTVEGNLWTEQEVELEPDAAVFAPPPAPEEPVVAAPNNKRPACSPVAARDPFCTETESPAPAAQEGDAMESEKKAEEEAPAEDDDNNDWLASLKLKPANQQACNPFESFDPAMGRKANPMMPAY